MSAEQLFRETFGAAPAVVASAPGRVNLIGEHTDYNNGLVLPFAIDARATVAVSPAPDGGYEIVSAQRPGQVVRVEAADVRPGGVDGWAAYVVGSGWVLDAPQGFRVALASDVPVGAGLSSSAAVECAAELAFSHLAGIELPVPELARRAQRAENDFVGMPCGLMDQMASAAGRRGQVLFFDIGADTVDLIPFDPNAQDLAVLLIDTRAHHSLADGEYAKRRAECERAAAELGVASLRDLDGQDLDTLLPPAVRRRAAPPGPACAHRERSGAPGGGRTAESGSGRNRSGHGGLAHLPSRRLRSVLRRIGCGGGCGARGRCDRGPG